MATEDSFAWIPFYEEFADKLLEFKGNRMELLTCLKRAFDSVKMSFPKIDASEPTDVDPFTVFGMFNKGLTDRNRTRIIYGLEKEFGISAELPTSFAGIPVLNNMSATFYEFEGGRGENDIDNLWNFFESALLLAGSDTDENRNRFIYYYDITAAQKRTRWNLTMALYWIRPYSYLNLDSRNRWSLDKRALLGEECADAIRTLSNNLPDGVEYLRIRYLFLRQFADPDTKYSSFPELSLSAWFESEMESKRIEAQQARQGKHGSSTIGDDGVVTKRYWLYAPGANATMWDDFYDKDIMALGWCEIADLRTFKTRAKLVKALRDQYGKGSYMNVSLGLWQFLVEMRVGDVVFAKRGCNQIIGRGIVTSDYEYDTENTDGYPHYRSVEWTDRGEWNYPSTKDAPQKTLTDITQNTGLVNALKALFDNDDNEEGEEEQELEAPVYTKKNFLEEVFMEENDYDELESLLKYKKNVILQGAPGVGKTFMAKRLAYSMMGCKDRNRVELVQFHQSYSYEDFIMGFRPSAGGEFELKNGAFYEFCKKAESDNENEYFFIIDEINRGNLSKIFGELFMLIEADKRGLPLRLLYSDEQFSIPSNIYIIGMMNTADRSLAMLDYALRRRFAFYDIGPKFDSTGFKALLDEVDDDSFRALIDCVKNLNDEIKKDDSLGPGFRIGHSYFCDIDENNVQKRLSEIVEYELVPLLDEYWFDADKKARHLAQELRNSIN